MKTLLVIIEGDPPREVELRGRDAWALRQLIASGPRGVTPIDNPAPRWSHYVWNLRGYGLDIETIHERHGGAFPGNHGRYVLRSAVMVREVVHV